MALILSNDLQASPDPFTPSGSIRFSVLMKDDAATPNNPVNHNFVLTLNADNGLTFDGNKKSVTRPRPVGVNTMSVVFDEHINGTSTGFGFNVALFEGPDLLTSADVTLGQ